MRVVFVSHPKWGHAGSTILRSIQMAEFCRKNIPEHQFSHQTNFDVKDAVVILHKFWLPLITQKELKTLRDNNVLIADPIDGYCPIETDYQWSIHSQQKGHYITHLVDTRIPRGLRTPSEFAIGYYGTLSNTIAPEGVQCVSCYEQGVGILSKFSAHYTLRQSLIEAFKPPLKIWTAAVCGVPVLTSMDNDVPLYLKDYRYTAHNLDEAKIVLNQMKKEFLSDKWEEAREQVKATYSDSRVIKDVKEFLDGIA